MCGNICTPARPPALSISIYDMMYQFQEKGSVWFVGSYVLLILTHTRRWFLINTSVTAKTWAAAGVCVCARARLCVWVRESPCVLKGGCVPTYFLTRGLGPLWRDKHLEQNESHSPGRPLIPGVRLVSLSADTQTQIGANPHTHAQVKKSDLCHNRTNMQVCQHVVLAAGPPRASFICRHYTHKSLRWNFATLMWFRKSQRSMLLHFYLRVIVQS